jgi:hypothetical protein
MRQESEFLTVVGTIDMGQLYTNTNNQFMINFMAKTPKHPSFMLNCLNKLI